MTIDRRRLITTTGAVALASALGLGTTRQAAAAQKLTGVTYLPPSYADLAYGSQGLVDRINEKAGETVAIDFYDSGRLLSADEQLPALRSGTIDFMFHTTSYVTRSLPILGITGLPGVVGDLARNPDRLKRGSPLFQLIQDELKKNGLTVLSLGGGIMEPEYIWSTKDAPIRNLDDIEGKKIRVVSFEATKAIEDLGGASVRIPSSELYLALQRGTVDAAVANISTINGRSIQEQVGHVYRMPLTGFAIWYKPTPNSTLGFQSFIQIPAGGSDVSDTNWKNLSSVLWDVRLTDRLGWTADAGFVFQGEKTDGTRPGTSFHTNQRLGYRATPLLEPFVAVDYERSAKTSTVDGSHVLDAGLGLMLHTFDNQSITLRYSKSVSGENHAANNSFNLKYAYVW